MSLPVALMFTWPQVFMLILLAIAGAVLAELVVGNAPRFGFIGSLVLGVLGAWIFTSLPLDLPAEPRLEDTPVLRGVVGAAMLVALFAYFRKQQATR